MELTEIYGISRRKVFTIDVFSPPVSREFWNLEVFKIAGYVFHFLSIAVSN